MRTIYLNGVLVQDQTKYNMLYAHVGPVDLEESGEYAVVEDQTSSEDCGEVYFLTQDCVQDIAKATMSAYSHEASLSLDDSYEGEE